MKAPARFKTRAGHRPRARVHAGWSPAGRRRARATVLRALGLALALLLSVGVALNAYAQSLVDGLPSVRGLDSAAFRGDVLVYDRNGFLLADLGQEGDHRVNVTLAQISTRLIQATVAIEDKNFYTNPGIDPEGIARAALLNVRSRSIVGGGSTITQQLAKQLFLSPEQTVERKLKEVALAYQLSRTYTKDEILQLYLNQSYYGEQQYGVQAAARTFFQKDARDLDLAEAAMLAGLPQAPAQWSPVVHPQASRNRQRQVLDAMVRLGYASSEEAAAAADRRLDIHKPKNRFHAPHFVDYVKRELETLGIRVGRQQLVVKTTLDWGKQELAERIVAENLAANRWRDRDGQLSSAMVAMDPRTGQLVVMVGSPSYDSEGGEYNFAADVPINPGSSVKPFTYGAVINARKATMDTPIADGPSPLELSEGPNRAPYRVFNYDGASHGVLPLRMALANSLNIPAVKAELAIGVPAVVEFWRSLGMRPRDLSGDPNGPAANYGASLTLGGAPVTLLQEVNALSVYAALGVYHEPEAILQVADPRGHVIYHADPDRGRRQVLDAGVAFIMAAIMSDDANRAMIFDYGSPLHLAGRMAAAKTGTTENFKDALTVGFTPDLASVVWVGDIKDLSHRMVPGSDAIAVAAPAWNRFMTEALKDQPDRWYDPPANLVRGPGNSWYLRDAVFISRLPNDNPTPKPSPVDLGIPSDPGGGPRPVPEAVPSPAPAPSPAPGPSPRGAG